MTRPSFVRLMLSLVLASASTSLMASCGQSAAPAAKPTATKARPATATAAPAPAPAKPLRNVLFTLDFSPAGYQAPFVAAVDRGYYKAVGLNVKIVPGKGSAITAQQVATGATTLGFADFGTSAFAIQRGARIQAVMVPEQGEPQCILSMAKRQITSPAMLKGHRIGGVIGTYDLYYLPAFLRLTHVPISSVKIVKMNGPNKLPFFENGKISTIVGNKDLEIPLLASKGFKINTLCYAHYGLNVITHSVFASRKLIAQDPGLVRSFVAATTKGYQFSLQHPAQAIADISRYFPSAGLQPAVAKAELLANLRLLHTQATSSKPIGWVAPQEVSYTLTMLKKYAGLKTDLPPQTFYTDAFIGQG